MSADNMVYVKKCQDGKYRAWHGFASDDYPVPPKTGLVAETDSRSEALLMAFDWTKENYTEYGVVELDDWRPPPATLEDRAAAWEQAHGFDKYGVAYFIRTGKIL